MFLIKSRILSHSKTLKTGEKKDIFNERKIGLIFIIVVCIVSVNARLSHLKLCVQAHGPVTHPLQGFILHSLMGKALYQCRQSFYPTSSLEREREYVRASMRSHILNPIASRLAASRIKKRE